MQRSVAGHPSLPESSLFFPGLGVPREGPVTVRSADETTRQQGSRRGKAAPIRCRGRPIMRPLLPLLFALVGIAATPASGETPQFTIGAIADCQFADEPDAPPRLYHTAPGKLR